LAQLRFAAAERHTYVRRGRATQEQVPHDESAVPKGTL
jgi:hypothetical protein